MRTRQPFLLSHSSLSLRLSGQTLISSLFAPRLLWFYLQARHGRDGHSYCSVKGCERVKVTATTTSKQICNCSAKAYPKYSKTPSAVVPMPPLSTKPCKSCGAKQVGATRSRGGRNGADTKCDSLCLLLSWCFPVSRGPPTSRHKSSPFAARSS